MRGRNVVLELWEVREGVVHFRLHLGCRRSLPAGFLSTYCAESWGERLLRFMAWCFCRQTRHHFRMTVLRYDAALDGAFAWRLEDAFSVLREAGFLLYDDGRGEWAPKEIYGHLRQQGRVSVPMPVLRVAPGGYEEVSGADGGVAVQRVN